MADAAPGARVTMPALPRGAVVFENIPLGAVVIAALAPALGDGSLLIRSAERSAVVLVRSGATTDVHAFGAGGHRAGAALLEEVQGWADAAVWAQRLDPALMTVCESLLTAEPLYDDLRLSWLSWPALLDDLAARGDAWLVEVTSSAGSGVLCLAPGRSSLSFTDGEAPSRSSAAIDALVAAPDGSVRVRLLDPSAFAALGHDVDAVVTPQPDPGPASIPVEAPISPVTAAAPDEHAPVNGSTAVLEPAVQQAEEPAPADLQRVVDDALTDLAWVAPWDAAWKDEAGGGPPGEPAPAARPVDVRAVLPDLRSIAQRRLQLSASRVEAVLDQAADQHMSLDSVLDEIRSMSIRGVMQSTVQDMVDEMAAAAAQRPV